KILYRAERQSIASSDRRDEGQLEKHPDFMYLFKYEDKLFELLFGESSRLVCTKNKINEDKVKLMKETNDGMALVLKKCQPEKEKFSIIGIQIAGNVSLFYFILFITNLDFINYYYFIETKIYLNVLLKDAFNI